MAVVDRRSPSNIYEKGSSLLAVYLEAAEAQEALDDVSATAGWYPLANLAGGELGPERQTEELLDEAGTLMRTKTVTDQFIITNTAMQTDDGTLKLFNWLESNFVPARYPLPISDDPATDGYQWWFFPRVSIRKEDWRIGTAREGQRQRQFTVVASFDETSGMIYDFATLPASQADAAWSAYGAYKDEPVVE